MSPPVKSSPQHTAILTLPGFLIFISILFGIGVAQAAQQFDLDHDLDVDGIDIALFAAGYPATYSNIGGLAAEFGRTETAVQPANWVKGYYVAYQGDLVPPEELNWKGLTEIVLGRVKANADGSLDENFDIGAPQGPALMQRVGALARQNGIKPILMLGGDDNGSAIHGAVRFHRAAFVANLISAMNRYGCDGLDLDWENDLDMNLFIALAGDLRSAAPNKILSVPVGTINGNYQSVDPKLVELAGRVDQMNIMSYYPATAWAGSGWLSWHNCPLAGAKSTTPVSIADSLQRYAAAGIPKSKLGMGISFYAIGYTNGITAPNQSTAGAAIVGGDNVYPLLKLFGPGGAYSEQDRKWDPAALCSYLSLPAPAKPDSFGSRYISFEDERSILEKGKFSRTNGYGGIIIWTINQGHVRTHSNPGFLMDALRKGFIEPAYSLPVGVSVSPAVTWLLPGTSVQMETLVTGTGDKGVAWSVQEANGGSVDQNGFYTAPSWIPPGSVNTFHVIASSLADPSKSAAAQMMVAEDISWDPGLTSYDRNEWWMSVFAEDGKTQTMFVEHKGALVPMQPWGTVWPNKPAFAVSTQVKAGEVIRFYAYSSDGRTARTVPITFVYGSGYSPCPIEGPIP